MVPEIKSRLSALSVQVGGDHYKLRGIQPIEYMLANNMPFSEGAVVKYVTRHRYKNGADDLKKAIHLLQIVLESDYDIVSAPMVYTTPGAKRGRPA